MARSFPEMTVADILQATRGVLVRGTADLLFRGMTTDSRVISEGNLFIALHGERFDGHDYLDEAVKRGAAGLLIHRDDGRDRGIPVILVDDTLTALGGLARAWHRRFPVPVLAITGSSGKTTTKEMVAAILAQKKKVLKTLGNYNNLIGLPLTLLGLSGDHEMAILEMGTNRPGEIGRLAEIAEPRIAVVTNIGPAHLEGFGSLVGVAKEKGTIFRYISPGGTAVINLDDPFCRAFEIDGATRRVTFGFDNAADVSAADVQFAGVGGVVFTLKIKDASRIVHLPVTGRHNIANALAAAASAWAACAEIDEIRHGLEAFPPVAGRMEIIPLRNGAFVINDAYNANPASVGEALETLRTLRGSGQGIAILGDMLELGEEAEARHRDIGGLLTDTGVTWVYLRGRLSRATAAGALNRGMAEGRITRFEDPSEIMEALRTRIMAGDWVLIKGSRGTKMEQVLDALMAKIGRKDEVAA